MTQFKPWTAEHLDWTLELWELENARYEWDTSFSSYKDEQQDWLQLALVNRERTPLFDVVLTDADVPIGLAMLSTMDWKNRSIQMRATVLPSTLERIDYLLEVFSHLVRRAFLQHNMYRVWMVTGEDVPDHHDALNEAGFIAEARRRQAIYLNGSYQDEISWSLLRPDWEAQRKA